jgi:hypothetical protein
MTGAAQKQESPNNINFAYWAWLYEHFDELVDEYKEFGRFLTVREWREKQDILEE